MVAFNFTVFTDKVADRSKRMTIRRTARAKPGDKLQLYTGMRTKACRKLVEEDAVCVAVFPICIFQNTVIAPREVELELGKRTPEQIRLSRLPAAQVRVFCDRFAQQDGFTDWPAMRDWFDEKYGLPFTGHAHVWNWPEDRAAEGAGE